MRFKTITFVAVLALLPIGSAIAQVQTGSILVRTVDEQGNAIPGVSVTITSPVLVAGQVTAVTNAGGGYRFPALLPGSYTVRAELEGFRAMLRESVVVSVGQTTPLEFVMTIAGVVETVTVTGSPTVDTTSANVSVTLNQELLQRTPGGRDIWSLVENKVPGLIIQRPDVGGNSGGLQARFTAKGTPSSENVQYLNGINVGNPGFPGNAGFYYDYESLEEVQVSTGAHDLSVPSSGVFVNMVTKSGGDQFAGKGSFFWQGDATQASNIDDELRRFGFRDDAGSVDFISDATVQFGGPIVAKRLRFFGSFRDWRVHVRVPDFPEIEETNITSGLANATWQVNANNRVSGFYGRQRYRKPNSRASANVTPESAFDEQDVFYLTQGLWNSVLTNQAFLDARVSYLYIFFPSYLKGTEQSLLDLSTGKRLRAGASENIIEWPRLQTGVNFQYYVDRALGGRHEFRVGIDISHAPSTTNVTRIDDLNLTFFSATGLGSTVQLFNSPLQSRSTVNETAIFAQDSYSVGRLTLTGGVRWERAEGYLPEQSSEPSSWFSTATRQFTEIRSIPNWKTVAPRVAVAYDVRGDGKTALKAAAGRYYYALSTSMPNSVNPNFNFSETYTWNDLNGDLRFQPGERGALLSRAGGLVTSLDPEIQRPYTSEFLVGLDHELVTDLKLSAVFTYREERNRIGSIDIGVPFSAYRAVSRTDPGRDGTVGTADDSTISVWDQDPATRGQNRFVTANSSAFNQNYRGLELTANKRFSKQWQMLAGYTLSRAVENALPGTLTPNSLINARGPSHFDHTHTFKLTGTYVFPRDVLVSGNLRVLTGGPVAEETGFFTSTRDVTRTALFQLTQGNNRVSVEPRGADRLDTMTTIDMRLSKIFTVAGRDLELMIDGYNLANANTAWAVRTLTGRLNVQEGGTGAAINVPQYRSPTHILGPRIFRLGASFRF